MKIKVIYDYMISVKTHLSNDSERPSGYNENDRDCGYRSALKLYEINRSRITDELASAVIYNRTIDESMLAIDANEAQMLLF